MTKRNMAANWLPFCIVAFACGQSFVYTGGDVQYRVMLDIYSGRPNPTWVIDRSNPLYTEIAIGAQRTPPTPQPVRLGYRGFYIESTNAFRQWAYKGIGAGTNPPLERMLFDSNPIPIQVDVRQQFMNYMRGRNMYHKFNRPIGMPGRFKKPRKFKFCKHPRFDPENWNIPSVQPFNNCYNYATQRITNTFAQPGKASGKMYEQLTAPSVMAAALRDGFIYLPFFAPKFVHGLCYMALVISPGNDYHWYRLDNNFRWSHKPGGTKATNRDNSGNLILDPRFADRGPYSVFAGFVGNHWGAKVA